MNWNLVSQIVGKYWAKRAESSDTALSTTKVTEIKVKTKKTNYWTLDDDQKLGNLAKELSYNWAKIASNFSARTSEEVERRWMQRFDPNTKKSPWTPEEDAILKNMHQKFGANWKLLSNYLPGRIPNNIKNRFYSFVKKQKNNTGEVSGKVNTESIDDDTLIESMLQLSDNEDTSHSAQSKSAEKNSEVLDEGLNENLLQLPENDEPLKKVQLSHD